MATEKQIKTAWKSDFELLLSDSSLAAERAQTVTDKLHSLDPESFAALEANLRPRRSATSGFIGKDEHLLDIIDADVAALAAIGLTPQIVGLRLQQYLWVSRERFNTAKFELDSDIHVAIGACFRGWQSCPFADENCGDTCGDKAELVSERFSFGSMDFNIHNTNNDLRIKGPGLITHLIVQHNFFESPAIKRYRVEPVQLARILGLA